MRDPAERPRHFRSPDENRNEYEGYDEPAFRRRSAKNSRDGGREPKSFLARKAARKSLRERDMEMEEEQRSRAYRSRRDRYRDEEPEEYEDDGPKTPATVRFFAWAALLAVFFAVGYLGANYAFKTADSRKSVSANAVSGPNAETPSGGEPAVSLGEAKYRLYIPEGQNYSERDISISKGLVEDDIKNILTMYVDALKETKSLENGTKVLNVFRSGEWLYADMSGEFLKSLKKIGQDKSIVVISGLIKTMEENFSPINKVKFYVEGKEVKDKKPVDLTGPWSVGG